MHTDGGFVDRSFCLEVWGDYACFTRPEMKVERVSYDVITPAAVRAIFEAIFWKPAIRWQPTKIEVLRPIQWTSVRRNEIGAVMSPRADGLMIEDHRQQRAGLILKDVRYRLHATQVYLPPAARRLTARPVGAGLVDYGESEQSAGPENPAKYHAIFERRARRGQCFTQPYLGCREFSCFFSLVQRAESSPISETRDLGFMVYDQDFTDPSNPTPAFFRGRMVGGVVEIPNWTSEEVRR